MIKKNCYNEIECKKKKEFIHFKCINAKAFYKMKKLIMLRIKVEDVGVLYLK